MNRGSRNIFHFFLFRGTGPCSQNFQKFAKVPQLVRESLFPHTWYVPHVGFYRGPLPQSCHVLIVCSYLCLVLSLFYPLLAHLSNFLLLQLD